MPARLPLAQLTSHFQVPSRRFGIALERADPVRISRATASGE